MKTKGGGKRKGSAFEREICVALSRWVTNGKRDDVFWRSAMSGGRATIHHRKGTSIRQSGDICAVAPEGHGLTSKWFIECKHLKHVGLGELMIKGTGPLREIWNKTREQAVRHRLDPMLIIKQNMWPVIVISRPNHLAHWTPCILSFHGEVATTPRFDVTMFESLMDRPYEFLTND